MDLLKGLEPLFLEPLFQFFLWMGIVHILAQIFIDRRPAFWIASISATYFWTKAHEPFTPLKAWAIILSVFLLYFLLKLLFHFNLFLYLKGKKRCPMCYSEVHWRAKVCPFCHHRFRVEET